MAVIQITNPYLPDGYRWLKGNLHTHTTNSDGELSPAAIITEYEKRDYDFLAISDHDTYVDPHLYQPHTRMILLPGVEVSAGGPHVLQIGAEQRLEPIADRRQVIDEIVARGGFAVLNHPNWERHFNHFPQEQMQSLDAATGLEVYNGVIERLEGNALAADRWDRLLSINHWLWAFANDDAHLAGDIGKAWNVVQVTGQTSQAVLEGLRHGRFYASTGVKVCDVRTDGLQITVHTNDAQRIRFVSRWGIIRASTDGTQGSYRLPDDTSLARELGYIRAECYGAGGQVAWTQPLKIDVM